MIQDALGFKSTSFLFPCFCFCQEPPEDEANIIEKILSVRAAKKEVKYRGAHKHKDVSLESQGRMLSGVDLSHYSLLEML